MALPLLCECSTPLTVDTVVTLFQRKENAVSLITKPTGGQVYLLKCDKGTCTFPLTYVILVAVEVIAQTNLLS